MQLYSLPVPRLAMLVGIYCRLYSSSPSVPHRLSRRPFAHLSPSPTFALLSSNDGQTAQVSTFLGLVYCINFILLSHSRQDQ